MPGQRNISIKNCAQYWFCLHALPIHAEIFGEMWWPGGQSHRKLPSVLMQVPPRQRRGLRWHSSMSVGRKEGTSLQDPALPPQQPSVPQHCNSCECTSLPNPFSGNDPAALLGVQSTYWDKAQDCSMYHTHATPACNLPLPCTNICAGAGYYYRPRNIPLSWLNPSLPIVCCLSQLHQPRLTLEPLLQLAIS